MMFQNKLPSRFLYFLATVFCLCAYGQNSLDDLLKMSLEDLTKIQVVSASKTAKSPHEAPGLVSLMTRTTFHDFDWQTIDQMLYLQPGFGPSQDYDRHTVSSRGLFEGWNNNHYLHLVDGVPMNDNLYGTAYTWEITPVFFLKSIEIMRGPGSALYGSNATQGVLSVSTPSFSDLEGKSKLTLRFGSLKTRMGSILTGFQTKMLGVSLGYQQESSDGFEYQSYDGSGRMDPNGNLETFQTADKKKSHYIWLKLEALNQLKGLVFQFHDQNWQFQTGHGWLWWIPDQPEDMVENRQILSLSYSPPHGTNWQPEFTVRYQNHAIDWDMRYYPDRAFSGLYPDGVWEYLKTDASDLFARAQVQHRMAKESSLLLGLEYDHFLYSGDKDHTSNIDIDGDQLPFPDGTSHSLGPWLHYIQDKPIDYYGYFAQYDSGESLGQHLKLTVGLRNDSMSIDYLNLNQPLAPISQKTFSQWSPRLALVYLAREDLSFKLLFGKAFRAPSPTELAGAHTFSLASNIEQLEPEKVTTIELASDWVVSSHLDWRSNLFYNHFQNQIAYSASNNNLSTNLYTLTTMGFESELICGYKQWSGFLNYSYAQRLDEEILDLTILSSPHDLTWDPSHKLNLGVEYQMDAFHWSLTSHYQGAVNRRPSDQGIQLLPLGVDIPLDMDAYRGSKVKSWFNVDGSFQWQIRQSLELGFKVTNVFNSDRNLIKNIGFPFDYRLPSRNYFGTLTYQF